MAKIILAGGSGFIGKILAGHFTCKGDEVVVLTRKGNSILDGVKYIHWDAQTKGDWANELENSDVLINLTGKSVNCRYNDKNKREILSSRINATKILGEAVRLAKVPPALWINSASATIYRNAEDSAQDEYTGEIGTGFSVDVCRRWEAIFFEQELNGIRKICLRIAVVLGKNGGVTPYYFNLARIGLGGRQGSGKQYFSWVHAKDLCGITDFIIEHKEFSGIFNVSSPNPVQNHELMAVVRKVVNMPFGLPATVWMLKIGTWLLRTELELVIKSRKVAPARLLNNGYEFKLPDIKAAINLCRS